MKSAHDAADRAGAEAAAARRRLAFEKEVPPAQRFGWYGALPPPPKAK